MIRLTELTIDSIAFGMPGGSEWIILLVLGLLIFGRRLPEVGRSLGRGIVEFKRGVRGIEDDIDDASTHRGPAQVTSESTPRIAEQAETAGGAATADVGQASVGSEAPNPYAPVEKPASGE